MAIGIPSGKSLYGKLGTSAFQTKRASSSQQQQGVLPACPVLEETQLISAPPNSTLGSLTAGVGAIVAGERWMVPEPQLMGWARALHTIMHVYFILFINFVCVCMSVCVRVRTCV